MQLHAPSSSRSKSYMLKCILKGKYFTGFKVLIAMDMKSSIICDITPCSQLIVNQLHSGMSQKIELLRNILFSYSIPLSNLGWIWQFFTGKEARVLRVNIFLILELLK
jgi:hypothetical protein